MDPDDIMALENLIIASATRMVTNTRRLHCQEHIDERQLASAINAYAQNVNPERVIVLYDDTYFGSATEGFMITSAGMYLSYGTNDHMSSIPFHQIDGVSQVQDAAQIHYRSGTIINIRPPCITIPDLVRFLSAIVEANNRGLVDEVDSFLVLETMSDDVKLAYLEVIIHMVYLDDGIIDHRERAELLTLMTQLNFSQELRRNTRELIHEVETSTPRENSQESLCSAIARLNETLPRGAQRVIHLSLMSDLVRVHRATQNTGRASEGRIIRSIAALLELQHEEVAFIENVYDFDQYIVEEDNADDGRIRTTATELASVASSLGVPMAALYVSGSVVGLSATGITSGLAALGLGGIFGLSSMVTGVGALLAMGGVAFFGTQYLFSSETIHPGTALRQERLATNNAVVLAGIQDMNATQEELSNSIQNGQLDRWLFDDLQKQIQVINTLQERSIHIQSRLFSNER